MEGIANERRSHREPEWQGERHRFEHEKNGENMRALSPPFNFGTQKSRCAGPIGICLHPLKRFTNPAASSVKGDFWA